MRLIFLLSSFALFLCLVYGKGGSINEEAFEGDVDDDLQPSPPEQEVNVKNERRKNPCARKKCYRGEECRLDKDKKAECVCRSDCSFYNREGARLQVCSNKNITYQSECELDADHCRCKRGQEPCTSPGVRKIHVNHYGHCQELPKCTESLEKQFPERMRDWLFRSMEELFTRTEIGGYKELLKEAEKQKDHAAAVIWKFCDLDVDPQDRRVTRRELQRTQRSFRSMEGCLAPFLDECDADSDKEITLTEWGICLQLQNNDIKDRCLALHSKLKNK